MSNSDSITGGLGLKQSCFDELKEISQKRFSENNTISDALEAIAEEVRDATLGETNYRVSEYEKKLILAGYITGLVRSEQKIQELKMLMALTLSVQGKGDIKPIPGGFAGAIDVSDMPKEVRDIISQIFGGGQQDDDDDDED